MLPLCAARIEDLGQGDFVKVDCAACLHVALLAPDFLLRLRAQPSHQGARRQTAGPAPGMRKERAGGGFDQVGAGEQVSRPLLPAPVKPSRRRRSFRPGRSALHRVIEHSAGAGRFVAFAHSGLSQQGSRPCVAHGTQAVPGRLSTGAGTERPPLWRRRNRRNMSLIVRRSRLVIPALPDRPGSELARPPGKPNDILGQF
jgi:hypothetical protein